jgi:phage protein D
VSFFATTISGLPPTGHYAPDFEVAIEGAPLDPESKGDVLSLKVVMDLENMTSAQIELNNWDDKRVWFKYSDRSGIYVGHRVRVKMGYADRLLSMLEGRINSLTPQFPSSGSSTLSVGVLDNMQLLKDRRPAEGEQRQFRDKSDGDIARAIASRNGLEADVDSGGDPHAEVVQGDLDDAQFLRQRARRTDSDCFIYTDPRSGRPTLRFGAPRDERAGARATNHTFVWGESLKSFSPTLSMSNQVSQVTVRGWNEDDMEPIVAVATQADIVDAQGGNTGAGNATTAVGGREDVVIGATVTTQAEALVLARALLRNRAYEFITGRGEIIGLPDLRPGDTMTLSGLGDRFSGSYYVKRVEHEIGANGYGTRFEVRKSYDEGARE